MAASAAFFIACNAYGQNAGTVTNHAFAIGKGAGKQGYSSVPCGSAKLPVGQASADPICQTITGDVTIDASGVTTIGANKVTNSMLATGTQDTVLGYFTSTTASATAVPDCTGALTYSTSTHTFSCSVLAGTGTVTQVNTGYGVTGGPITTTGTIDVSLSNLTNSLGSDVDLNDTGSYFPGPSVPQGTTGTWFVSGTVTLTDTGGAADFYCELWDGTTVFASGATKSASANYSISLSLSGVIASPSGNSRIDCKDATATTGKILYNKSGNSKDSTLTAVRIQ